MKPTILLATGEVKVDDRVIGLVRPDGGSWYAYPVADPYLGAFNTAEQAADALLAHHTRAMSRIAREAPALRALETDSRRWVKVTDLRVGDRVREGEITTFQDDSPTSGPGEVRWAAVRNADGKENWRRFDRMAEVLVHLPRPLSVLRLTAQHIQPGDAVFDLVVKEVTVWWDNTTSVTFETGQWRQFPPGYVVAIRRKAEGE